MAFKTPLDSRYDQQIPPESRFTPSMLIGSMRSYKANIGLWIDLTNTSRFYSASAEVEEAGIQYEKLQCRGHGETPNHEQTQHFIRVCHKFSQQHPLEIIAVHCTHGFNRTGFLIAAYLVCTQDWSPEAAVEAFARARPPGIYKEHYIQELFVRYGDPTDAPSAPALPDWCIEDEEPEAESQTKLDDDGNPLEEEKEPKNSQKRELRKKNAKFMDGVPGVFPEEDPNVVIKVQRKVQNMLGWKKSGFPGAQPVSMDRDNMKNLGVMPYKVSWKADGTRYMMLIDGENKIYFVDRDNQVFHVNNMTFLHRKMPNKHLANTLLDGEMVIDSDGTTKTPRYLIYDIIRFEMEEVGKTVFSTRRLCIHKEIVNARNEYIKEGKIDKTNEPFRIRAKEFWPLQETAVLLGPKFSKESLGHEPDGLVFQPSDEPYRAGRDDNILKWKPSSHNSVDFKLQVVKEERVGMLPETLGYLYVGGLNQPFDCMRKMPKEVRQLHGRIIECTWDPNKGWIFMRERTDKSYPNGFNTAQGT